MNTLLFIGNIMDKLELYKILIEEKAVVKLVRRMGDGKYHTRALLEMLGGRSYGHKLLLRAEKRGLVEREKVRPEGKGNWRVYNKRTKKGEDVLKLEENILHAKK